jgi:hypothetical protein
MSAMGGLFGSMDGWMGECDALPGLLMMVESTVIKRVLLLIVEIEMIVKTRNITL